MSRNADEGFESWKSQRSSGARPTVFLRFKSRLERFFRQREIWRTEALPSESLPEAVGDILSTDESDLARASTRAIPTDQVRICELERNGWASVEDDETDRLLSIFYERS